MVDTKKYKTSHCYYHHIILFYFYSRPHIHQEHHTVPKANDPPPMRFFFFFFLLLFLLPPFSLSLLSPARTYFHLQDKNKQYHAFDSKKDYQSTI